MDTHQHLIELQPSGKTFLAGDQLLLDAALAAGLSVPFSCRRGQCGSCKARVLHGNWQSNPAAAEATEAPYPLSANEILLCQSHACENMSIEIPGWHSDVQPLHMTANITEKIAGTSDVIRLNLQPQAAIVTTIRPGQYMKLYLEDGTHRCFSIANLPTTDNGMLTFHIRKIDGGRFSHLMLDALGPGDTIQIAGPFGACTWQSEDQVPVVCMVTGTGYAAIKPMLLAALATGKTGPLTLYWGASKEEDFYDSIFLDHLAARLPTFRWHAVVPTAGNTTEYTDTGFTRTGFIEELALQDKHPWQHTHAYVCGNSRMVNNARIRLCAAGLPEHHFFAEAFVPSGEQPLSLPHAVLDPVWEKVGPKYSIDGMLAAREQSKRAFAQIVAKLKIGMTTADAIAMANAHLKQMGASHTWHPTYIRFGEDTVKTPRQQINRQRTLRAEDIVVIDLGPVWDGYEGDFGDTIASGENDLYHRCAQAARDIFEATRQAWHAGYTGKELYNFAEQTAATGGWVLERNLAGHRVCDFPHALYGPAKLAEMDIVPNHSVWVLEIQIRHPVEEIGAFYEDILLHPHL